MGWFLLAVLGVATLARKSSSPGILAEPAYVGLSTDTLNYITAAQAQDMWCWAACVQTVLNWYGVPVDQGQVVTRVYGGPINEPGTDFAISASLNGWGFDSGGRRVVVQSHVTSGAPSLATLVRELARQRPVLVTLNQGFPVGHAVVITSISHVGRCITSLAYRDPWPSPENRETRGRVEVHGGEVSHFLSSVRSHWLVSASIS